MNNKSMNNEQLTKIKQHSDSIVKLCESPNTALQAIHQIVTVGGAGELAWRVVNHRTLADKDITAGLYLLKFLKQLDNLPFEGLPLIEMILKFGDDKDKQAMYKNLPQSTIDNLKALGLI